MTWHNRALTGRNQKNHLEAADEASPRNQLISGSLLKLALVT